MGSTSSRSTLRRDAAQHPALIPGRLVPSRRSELGEGLRRGLAAQVGAQQPVGLQETVVVPRPLDIDSAPPERRFDKLESRCTAPVSTRSVSSRSCSLSPARPSTGPSAAVSPARRPDRSETAGVDAGQAHLGAWRWALLELLRRRYFPPDDTDPSTGPTPARRSAVDPHRGLDIAPPGYRILISRDLPCPISRRLEPSCSSLSRMIGAIVWPSLHSRLNWYTRSPSNSRGRPRYSLKTASAGRPRTSPPS
jgi:hypothetical protein